MMDIGAALFELIGEWLVGSKSRLGFLLKLVSNILWAAVAWTYGLNGLGTVCLVMAFVNLRNYFVWRQNGTHADGDKGNG